MLYQSFHSFAVASCQDEEPTTGYLLKHSSIISFLTDPWAFLNSKTSWKPVVIIWTASWLAPTKFSDANYLSYWFKNSAMRCLLWSTRVNYVSPSFNVTMSFIFSSEDRRWWFIKNCAFTISSFLLIDQYYRSDCFHSKYTYQKKKKGFKN